jgi:hypothetical protein
MLIMDAIRRAGTAKEVCYLLTSYVETLQFCSASKHLPASVTALPVQGLNDITARLAGLDATQHLVIAQVSGRIGSAICDEAANLFRAALFRLGALDISDAANYSFDRRSNVRPDQTLTL